MSDKNFMSYEDAEEVLTEYANDIKENRATAAANEANITKIFADIAETEEETALTDHAVGDYILLDGVFFKVTSAIETGDSIVENTNVERATIDEILKVLREDIDKKQDYIFRGTHDEWEALTTAQKATYDLVAFTDDTCVDGDAYISGTVAEGDYNAVSSDAVAKELKNKVQGTIYGVRLNSSNDLDDVIEAGFYSSNGVSIPTNAPISSGHSFAYIVTSMGAGYLVQKAFATSGSNQGAEYERYCINNVWGTWKRIDAIDAITNGEQRPVTSNAVYDYVDTMITQALNAGY